MVEHTLKCEHCGAEGFSYNDNGEWLCEQCLFEYYIKEDSDE